MVIKVEVNLTNRWLYSIITFGIILSLGVGVWAYNSNMRAGDPSTAGHSAGEIMIENTEGDLVKLQDYLDENYFASKQLYFGGMYGNPVYPNPLAGNKYECPTGYRAVMMRGVGSVDHVLHLCVGIPGEVEKIAEFGGMYGNPSYPNPLAGNKYECPAGYIKAQAAGESPIDHLLHYCYKKDLNNPVIDYFGGMYGSPSYPNPATVAMACPFGYRTVTALGVSGQDHVFTYCYV